MRRASFALAVILLAGACGSAGGILGGLGGILGSPSADKPSDVRGVVSGIDTRAQRIDLDVQYVNNLRQSNSTGAVYYDSRTTVEYQGTTYRVEDLERGDEISVRGHNDSNRYVAEVITVTRNARR